ncbi:MAG: TolC family protein [Desulfobacteraceae bacterium]|nr:TolC family protein [Desulfobacteraceae bacterium]
MRRFRVHMDERFWGLLFTMVLVITVQTQVIAQVAQPLTLNGAIAVALKHNPDLQAVRHQVDAVSSQIVQARSGLLPQLNLSETYSRTNSPLWAFGTKLNQQAIESTDFIPGSLNEPDSIDNFNTALSLSWNIFDGGKTWIGLRQAQQNHKAADLNLSRAEQQVVAQTAIAYAGMMLAIENREVVLQSLDTAKAHLKVVQDRFSGGLAVKSDLLRAQVRIADLEQQFFQAGSQIQVTQAILKSSMGRWDDTPLKLTTSFRKCIPTKGDLKLWVNRALKQRPDLQQLTIERQIAKKQIGRARAEHWPSLALQGSYDWNCEDFSDSAESYNVGAVIRLNLFSGQRISAQIASAKSMLARVQSRTKSAKNAIRVETERAFHQARSTWLSIDVAQSAVEQADEALRIVSNRYRGGLLTIVSLLDAQEALQQARTRHFTAMHDYKVARIQLALAVGRINKDWE